MLGNVYGPYTGEDNLQYVKIVTFNQDGTLLCRKKLNYRKYLKEYDEGMHRYLQPTKRSILQNTQRCSDKNNNNNVCKFCKNNFILQSSKNSNGCCSVKCNKKLKRKIKNNKTLCYDKQFIVSIKDQCDDNKKYFIIYETQPGNRGSFFIDTCKCTITVSDDENSIRRYSLKYNPTDAVRVKSVVKYKKYFWITETGILISKRTKKVLKQTLSKTGYWTCASKINGRHGKNICFKIHRLIAFSFIPNHDNKPFINHIDGVKTNNKLSNLEWCTSKENYSHAKNMGLIKYKYGEDANGAIFTNNQVKYLRNAFKSISPQISVREFCKIMDTPYSSMKEIMSGRTYKFI